MAWPWRCSTSVGDDVTRVELADLVAALAVCRALIAK